MNLIKNTAENLGLPEEKIAHTIELLRDQNTVPFIARYRKEKTGNLNEDQIRQIKTEWQRLQNLEDRRQTILKSIAEQEKLTEDLKNQIYSANTLTILEDIYLPYRPKRRTRALIAKEKGLEPLANLILQQKVTDKSLRIPNITLHQRTSP
jgi:protein Tex